MGNLLQFIAYVLRVLSINNADSLGLYSGWFVLIACVEVWPGLLGFGYPVSLQITRATKDSLMILIQCSCYPALRRSHSCGYYREAKYYSARHAFINDEIRLVDTNYSPRTTYLHGRAWRSAILHLRVPGLLAASLWMHPRKQYKNPAEAVYQATLCRERGVPILSRLLADVDRIYAVQCGAPWTDYAWGSTRPSVSERQKTA
ncbi:hypothetical protein IG631_05509 [Alternaria alternata]|nr:hypothetical protein IG631_05509 [Alternaria alternata]